MPRKRGLLTTGGQIPIEKHYHSFISYCAFETSVNLHDKISKIIIDEPDDKLG